MRTPRTPLLVLGLCLIATLAISAVPVEGQQPWLAYSAKFVCGGTPAPPAPTAMARGKYKSVIDIHNPHYLMDVTGLQVPVTFFKKAVLSLPQGNPPFPPSCKQEERLEADQALHMDCGAIKGLLALSGLPNTGRLEGFLVIEVPPQAAVGIAPPLDVTAIYAAQPSAGEVTTLDVEQIRPTEIIGNPDSNLCAPD